MRLKVNDPIRPWCQLPDGATGKFPIMILRDHEGTPLSAATATLTHIQLGFYQYQANDILMPDTPKVTGTLITFDDALHTTESTAYYRHDADFELEVPVEVDSAKINEILSRVTAQAGDCGLEGIVMDEEITGVVSSDSIAGTVSDTEMTGTALDGNVEGEVSGGSTQGSVNDDTITGETVC